MKRIAALASLLLVASLLAAQTPAAPAKDDQASPNKPVIVAPSGVRIVNSDGPVEIMSDLSQQPVVLEKQVVKYRFESDGSSVRTDELVLRVQSEAGVQELGQLKLGYNSGDQELQFDYVRVRKADGSVVETDLKTAVQDLTGGVADMAPMYTDYRVKHVTISSLRPGDKLEYQTRTITRKSLAPGQFWMEHYFSDDYITLDSTLVVDVPADKKINLKTEPRFANFDTKVADGRIVYTWKFANLATREDRNKAEMEKNGKIKKRPRETPPSVQLTTFKSWSELGAWYGGLEADRRVPNDEMKAKVLELTRDKKTPREKIEAVYDFVAKTYRYVSLSFGIGRYQPHASTEVFKNVYGDCKDKHTLLASLLSVLGYRMNTVLIGSDHKLDVDVPSPSQFDHVIGNLKLGDETIWMDTTSEIAPMGVLVQQIRGKQAVQIAPDGATSVVRTPEGLPILSTASTVMVGKVSKLGALTAHVVRTARGDQEVALRSYLRRTPKAQWEDLVNYLLLRGERINGKATNIVAQNLEDTTQNFVMEYDVDVPNFYDFTAKDTNLRLPMADYGQMMPSLEDDDPDPAKLYGPMTIEANVSITFPDSITLTAPIPVSVKRDYGSYAGAATVKGHVLIASRHLEVKPFEMPTTRARDYTSFVNIIARDAAQMVSLKNSDTDVSVAASAPSKAKKEELEQAAFNAQQAHKFQIAIDLLQRVVAIDPKHPRAWASMALCYSAMTQYDKAVEMLNKAIEVNPYDERAYNFLGGVYELQQKYEEAKGAYRKQLEVNPLDADAHYALGRLMMRDHNYKEGVTELEAANGITPNSPAVLQQLGEGYLNTNQVDKAMESFDKAIEQSSTPMTWNNISYVLAKSKVHLEKALQLASSAVSSTTTALANLSPEKAEWEGRSLAAALATYWDTLGWVYFQSGDLKKAEQWLAPAWARSLNGEVGDHLAQVYEKKGEKEKAIELYGYALVCPQASADTPEHLKAILGGKPAPSGLKCSDLQKPLPLKAKGPVDGSADLLLIFKGDGSVSSIKQLGGDKALASLFEEIKSLQYPYGFPEPSISGFVQKATLNCKKNGACSLSVQPADMTQLGAAEAASGEGVEGAAAASED